MAPRYQDPRPQPPREQQATPGQQAVVLMMLCLGVLLLGAQLWLLTVALDLFLAGAGEHLWAICLVSGLIFVGGLVVLWLQERQRRHPS
jgi:hypothetical protein